MNRAESERLEARFAAHGYSPGACAEEADIIVVNSCVVRQHAEDKVVNKLYNLKRSSATAPACASPSPGVSWGRRSENSDKRFPYVDDFLKPGEIPAWLQKEDCSPSCP